MQITSTSDPEWKQLLKSIMQPSKSFSEEGIDRMFSAFRKMHSIDTVPDFIIICKDLQHLHLKHLIFSTLPIAKHKYVSLLK